MGKKLLPVLPAFVVPESQHKNHREVKDEPNQHENEKRNKNLSLPALKAEHHRPHKSTEMDAFAYCSNYDEKDYKEYRKRFKLKTDDKTGNTRGKYDAEFERKQVKGAIHIITTALKNKGLETPFLILPFRPNQSDGLVKDFLNMIFDEDGSIIEEEKLEKICSIQDELTLMSVLKFFWCRLPGNAVIGWKTYTEFVKMEEDAKYPPRAFLEFMPSCLNSGAHASIVYDFFDLLVAMVMKCQYNHLSARKLSRLCGLWAFHPVRTHKSSIPSFERGLYEWIPAGDAVFHLFLAFVKAMPPEGRVNRLPKQLQHILKTSSYPPTPTAASDESATSKYAQKLPMVTLRVNSPSENPAEMLSRVSKTLKFDDASLYYTREDFLLLKRLFKDSNTIMRKLSPEGSRILDNVCLYDEDLVSDGTSDHGNKIKYQLLAGWSLDMTAEGGRKRAKRSPTGAKPKKSQMPDFFTASIGRVSVDDYFIWTWMASLGPEETNIKKKTFGKTYIMEAQLAEGFKKWVVVEEQDLERDKYDVEIEIKKQKLQALEDQIKMAKKKAAKVALKESGSSMRLSNFTKKALAEKRAEKMDNSLPPPPPPKKDYRTKANDASLPVPPLPTAGPNNGEDNEFRRLHMSVLTGAGTEDSTEHIALPNGNNDSNGRYLNRRPPTQGGYPQNHYEKNERLGRVPPNNYRRPQLLTQHYTPSPPAGKYSLQANPGIVQDVKLHDVMNDDSYVQENRINRSPSLHCEDNTSKSPSPVYNGAPFKPVSPEDDGHLSASQPPLTASDNSTYYTANSVVPPIREGQPKLYPPESSGSESSPRDDSATNSMDSQLTSESSKKPHENAHRDSRSPSPLAGGRSERTSRLIGSIDNLESQIKDLLSEDGEDKAQARGQKQTVGEQRSKDIARNMDYPEQHRTYPNATPADYSRNTGKPAPGNMYTRRLSAQPRMAPRQSNADHSSPPYRYANDRSQPLAPPPGSMPYSSPYGGSNTSFDSAKSMPSEGYLLPMRSQAPSHSPSPSPARRSGPRRPVSSYGFPAAPSGAYPHHHHGQSMAPRGYGARNRIPMATGGPYYAPSDSRSPMPHDRPVSFDGAWPMSFSGGAPTTYSGPHISPPPVSRNYYNMNPSYPVPPSGNYTGYPNSAYSVPARGQISMQQPQHHTQGAPTSASFAPGPNAGTMSQGLIQNIPPGGCVSRLHGIKPTNRKQARSALMQGDFGI